MEGRTVELVVVAVVVALVGGLLTALVLAELWLRSAGLDLARRELATTLGVDPDRVAVGVDARTLLPVLLGRADTRVRVQADDVPVAAGEGMLRDLLVELHGVRGQGGLRPDALLLDGGHFVAHLDERELPALLPLRGTVTRVELRADGVRLWTVAAVPLRADLVVAGEELLIQADPAQLTELGDLPGMRMLQRLVSQAQLKVPLPTLPLDASIRELDFDEGTITVRGKVPPQLLRRHLPNIRAREAANGS